MFQIPARKRLFAVTLFVFCVVAFALKFGAAGKAGTFPLSPLPLLTATKFDAVVTDPLSIYASPKIGRDVAAELSDGRSASVVIFLTDQADVGAAYNIKDEDERGWFVYNTLTKHAERTQADLKSFLTSRGVEFQSFWAANMIVATVDLRLAEQIAERADVANIKSNRPIRWIEDPAIADRRETSDRPDDPEVAETGVINVNAPAVWALGFTGQNMVIGNQDTGIRWSHNAIKPKYRGWDGTTADHNFNWHDSIHSGGGSCGFDTLAPCDDNGHGTHTTGTTTGDDGTGNQVGVAPGAKWIGCRNMDQGNGTPATYTECFQFFIAPTDLSGNNPNPTLRPHVMNNSWGCPIEEGCTTGAELETIVNNTQAAGVFVVVSAGNAGPGCSSVADAPAFYNASFSVGSISGTTNTLSSFSSRGPSLFYNPSILKPNISAPGSGVRSSTRTSDTSYGNSSGTSMAGPHVAGVVALLWSARPQLERDIAATKVLLQNTANPNVTVTGGQTCGGTPSTQIPNNSFGYGRIDALAAVNAAGPTPTATNTPSNTPTVIPSPFPELDLTISQSAPPIIQTGGNPQVGVLYTLTVTNSPAALGGSACPTVRFGYPSGMPFTFTSASGTNGYSGTPDANGVTFTGGCISSSGGTAMSATLTVVVTTIAGCCPGTLTSFGNNVVVDPENAIPENNENNNMAQTIQTFIAFETQTPTPTNTSTPTNTPTATATPNLKSRADFDGDGKTDLSVFRPSEGNWYINRSSAGLIGMNFGLNGDVPMPGDYDGDGKTDIAVFRGSPTGADPDYFVLNSATNTVTYYYWGLDTDTPLIGDHDGDGKTDISVYRSSNNTFYIMQSTGGIQALNFGAAGDIPMFMDYEGDGRSNLAVFRPISATWYIAKATGVPAFNFYAVPFGASGDQPVPADYDGDDREDIAVFRVVGAQTRWYVLRSSDGGVTIKVYGLPTDIPVPGDYDGDGKADIAVYRTSSSAPGFWFVDRSSLGFFGMRYGTASDIPIPSKYIP